MLSRLLVAMCYLCVVPVHGQLEPVIVADLSINIPGSLEVGTWMNDNPGKSYPYPSYTYGFLKGDVLVLDFTLSNGKGTQTIEIKEHNSGSVVYSNQNFSNLSNVQVNVPDKSAYTITLGTNHVFPRTGKLQIKRIPANEQCKGFNCNVSWKEVVDTVFAYKKEQVLLKSDTIVHEVMDRKLWVYSVDNANPNKTVVDFSLPPNTAYWVYWIGVGQESADQMKKLTETVSSSLSLLGITNPLVAFGFRLIPSLPMLNAKNKIDMQFMDFNNARLFLSGMQCNYYPGLSAQNIVTDYKLVRIESTPAQGNQVAFGFTNNSTFTGTDVFLKVVAFEIKHQYTEKTVKVIEGISKSKKPILSAS